MTLVMRMSGRLREAAGAWLWAEVFENTRRRISRDGHYVHAEVLAISFLGDKATNAYEDLGLVARPDYRVDKFQLGTTNVRFR